MIIALDTETYEYNKSTGYYEPVLNAQKFVLGCIKTDTGITKFFTKKEEMLTWLINTIEKNKKQKRLTYIYAHNTEYDWYAIIGNKILNENIKYIIFSPFLAIYKEKGYISDTMSFYRTSLEKLGKTLGYPKLTMPKRIKQINELKEYLNRDVEIVIKSITTLKEKLKELGFQPRKLLTAGQLAMTCFLTHCRKNYTEKYFTTYNEEKKRREIIKPKNPQLIRQAYRGGDTQAHKIGKFKNVTLIDINGLYADMMRKMKFPDLKTETLIKKPTIGMLKKYLTKEIGIAQLTIKAPKTQHPILPIRYAKYQIFASNTELKGTWTFLEIKKAIEQGYKIKSIEWCIRWKELKVNNKPFNPLKEFIEKLYKIEKESKTKIEKIPIKLIRNNLYGKFAQYKKNKDIKIVPRHESMKYINQGYESKSRYNNNYVLIKETDVYKPSYTNAIISVIITAMGRLKIHEEEKKIPYENRLYKDTDSLMFTDPENKIIKEFKISKELGDWKIEEQNKKAKILGEKRYYIGENVKISGVHSKNRTKDVIDREETIKVKKMFGLGSAIQTGNWNEIGTFTEQEMEMKPHTKNQIPIPEKIDETTIKIAEKIHKGLQREFKIIEELLIGELDECAIMGRTSKGEVIRAFLRHGLNPESRETYDIEAETPTPKTRLQERTTQR